MTLFSKKKRDKIFPFHIYFSHLCKTPTQKKKKKLIMTCVFECFQSHYHIFKELHEFLMGAITIVGESSFIFSDVIYGLVTKSLGVGCTFEEVA
jgi:hypothetical protein